jgi:acetylornithine deacetylase
MTVTAGTSTRRPPAKVDVASCAEAMVDLLVRTVQFESTSGSEGPLVRFLAKRAREMGFSVDLWEGDEAAAKALGVPVGRHLPLAGRLTLVIALCGRGGGRSLLFNAHSDVVAAGGGWTVPPWEGRISSGRLYGRGACDTKGPLISALWAMVALQQSGVPLAGDVLLEVVPGEEDCVGLGSLTSVARGHRADAAVVLEPTQNLPRLASRPGCRFELVVAGRAVHGSFKWLGVDAIGLMRRVLGALDAVEKAWPAGECAAMAPYPIARPVTVDSIHGDGWQGMICDRCTAAGYLELLPGDDLRASEHAFEELLRAELSERGVPQDAVALRFTERYLGHLLDEGHELCLAALETVKNEQRSSAGTEWLGWAGFNSGCEAGVRSKVHGTPTLVWGPGDLGLAHAPDEYVSLEDVRQGAAQFASLALSWCSQRRDP